MKEHGKGKFLGSVTVGERGQVVIPVNVRKSFKIKPGDKLVVLGEPGNMFSLVPEGNFTRLLNEASELLSRFNDKQQRGA